MSVAEMAWKQAESQTEIYPYFEKAPLGWAQCDPLGRVTALNPVLEQKLSISAEMRSSLSLANLLHSQDQGEAERQLSELLAGKQDKFQIDSRGNGQSVRWTVWRVPKMNGESDCVLAVAEDLPGVSATEERLRQAQRLE